MRNLRSLEVKQVSGGFSGAFFAGMNGDDPTPYHTSYAAVGFLWGCFAACVVGLGSHNALQSKGGAIAAALFIPPAAALGGAYVADCEYQKGANFMRATRTMGH